MSRTATYSATVEQLSNGKYLHRCYTDGEQVEQRTSHHRYTFWNHTPALRGSVFSQKAGQVTITEATPEPKPAKAEKLVAKKTSKAKASSKAPAIRLDGQPRGRAVDSEDGSKRTCSRCGTEKPLDKVHYYQRANGSYCSHCRDCNKAIDKAARAAKKPEPVAA